MLSPMLGLYKDMPPKPEEPRQSESRRGRSPRWAALQPPSKSTVTRSAKVMAQRVLWQQLLGPTGSCMARWLPRLRAILRMLRRRGSRQIKLSRSAEKPWTSWRKRRPRTGKRSKKQWPKWGQRAVLVQHRLLPLQGCKPTLDAGVHPRAAKKADKDRPRAASHRAATGRDRTASWNRFKRQVWEISPWTSQPWEVGYGRSWRYPWTSKTTQVGTQASSRRTFEVRKTQGRWG